MSDVTLDFKVMGTQANNELTKLNGNVKKLANQTTTSKLALANLASAAVVNGLKAGFNKITQFMDKTITLAIEQENAINDLNIALKSLGTFSQSASQDLQDFASQLQQNSIYGDEALLSVMALGSQMAQLSGQELKDATTAAANMASALNIDLNTAMRLIAKSVSDGGSGLKRYGIEVDKGATGAETLANAVSKVNEQFSNAAAGKIETYGGAITQANNSYGDMLEELGKLITEDKIVISQIGDMNDLWVKLGGFVKDNADTIKTFAVAFGVAGLGISTVIAGLTIKAAIATTAFGVFWNALIGPIGIAIVGLTAISAAIYKFYATADENKKVRLIDNLKIQLDTVDKQIDNTKERIAAIGNVSSSTKNILQTNLVELLKKQRDLSKQVAEEENKLADTKPLYDKLAILKKVRDEKQAEIDLNDKLGLSNLGLIEAQKSRIQQIKTIEEDYRRAKVADEAGMSKELQALHNEFLLLKEEGDLLSKEGEQERASLNFKILEDMYGAHFAARYTIAVKHGADTEARLQLIAKNQIKAANDRLTRAKTESDRLIAIKKKQTQQFNYEESAQTKWQEGTWNDRINQTSYGLNAIAGLMYSSNREMFEIGKAAAIVNATVQTYQAATAAYASLAGIPVVGPALGAAASAAAIITGLANVKAISSTPKPAKAAQGAIVGGNSTVGDQIPYMVNSGEVIFNKPQQQQLFAMANGNGGGNNTQLIDEIRSLKSSIANMEIAVYADTYEIGRTVNRAVDQGLVLKTN